MQGKSSRVFLLVAVVLGVVATVTTFAFLESSSQVDRGPKTTILVAARDLKPNTPLEPEKDLKEMEMPARMGELKQRALQSENKASYRGQRLNRRVLAGTPVLLADLSAIVEMPPLEPDKRALSIPIKGTQALGGLLVPGDFVKILVTRPVAQVRINAPASAEGEPTATVEPASKFQTKMVLPNAVKVLAVNSRLARRQQISAADQYEAAAGESASQQSVMLEVTEAEALMILEMTGAGQLPATLILCPPSTTQPTHP